MTHPTDPELLNTVLQLLTEQGLAGFAEGIRLLVNEAMRLERQHVLQAQPYERTASRQGQANGFKDKTVACRVGPITFDIPQVRDGVAFYPSALEKGRRSEQALKLALAEMYVQGVSTRKVSAIVEQLCGVTVSSTQVSQCTAKLDVELQAWRTRPLAAFPYLVVDARYEKVRQNGQLLDCAILIALGIGRDAGVNIPWLAFCSGNYLKRAGRIVPLPVATLRHAPNGFAYSDRTETFDDELGLPRVLTLFSSHSMYEASVNRFNKFYLRESPEGRRGGFSPPGYADGDIKFHYEVLIWTNFLGWTIPLKFHYVQNEYAQLREDGQWKWHLRYSGVGQVTSLRQATKPTSVFVPTMQQTFVDYRFHHPLKRVDALVYPSTAASVSPTNDPVLQTRFRERVASASLSPAALAARVRWVLGITTFLSIMIMVLVILRRKGTHNNKQSYPHENK